MIFSKATLDCVIETISEKYHSKIAIVFEEKQVRYADLYMFSSKLAKNLRAIGVKKNDKVAILLPNCIEYLYTYFSLFMLGAWAVPFSTRWTERELENIIEDSGVQYIVYKDRIGIYDYNKILANIKKRGWRLRRLIVSGKSDIPEAISLEKLLQSEGAPGRIGEEIEERDVALLAYTSGTTGTPKGVMISHGTLVKSSYYTGKLWARGEEVTFSIAPLYAAQGFLAVLIDLVSGISMKWFSGFNPNDILFELSKKDSNVFHTQPTMWGLLLSLSYIDSMSFEFLEKVVVSGSLCSAYLAKKIEETMGCKVLNAYGLIEATGVVTVTRETDPQEVRLNTVGRPIEGAKIKIVDDNRKEVKRGEIGELAVKGYLMNGYYNRPEQTQEMIDDEGWLYTGDLAQYYDEENISIVGRKKDMIIRGGFNVYPIDIEECILELEDVENVAVIGKEDAILGETINAFVVPRPGKTIESRDILMHCRKLIANYKIPDEVIFVSQLPVLLAGKVNKKELKRWIEEGIPLDSQVLFNSKVVR